MEVSECGQSAGAGNLSFTGQLARHGFPRRVLVAAGAGIPPVCGGVCAHLGVALSARRFLSSRSLVDSRDWGCISLLNAVPDEYLLPAPAPDVRRFRRLGLSEAQSNVTACSYERSLMKPAKSETKPSKYLLFNFVDCLEKRVVRWRTHTEHRGPTLKEKKTGMSKSFRGSVLFAGLVVAMVLGFAQVASAQLIISEFRVRGPNGVNDEFIEIYNNSGADHTVAGGGTGYGVAASNGVARCVIPNGTVIPNRGHYLCVNSVGYSLASYPAGNGTTATGDATYTTDIPDNAGIAIFNTSVAANFTLANRLDAVGSTSEANTLYKEGTGYPALVAFSIND